MLVVFYDSDCGLCSRFIQLLLRLNIKGLSYAPLHGQTYKLLMDSQYNDLDSVIFYQNGSVYIKAAAVFKILSLRFKVLAPINKLPIYYLDPIYDLLARHRKKIFPSSCKISQKTNTDLFLK